METFISITESLRAQNKIQRALHVSLLESVCFLMLAFTNLVEILVICIFCKLFNEKIQNFKHSRITVQNEQMSVFCHIYFSFFLKK